MTGFTDAAVPEEWFLGVRLAMLGIEEAAHRIAERPPTAPFAYVVTPNAQHVVRIDRGDPAFLRGYEAAWMRLCDSQIMRLLGRVLFGRRLPLAAGSDLTLHLLRQHVAPDDAVTVIGGNAELAARLCARHGLRRLAQHVPPMGFYRDPAEIARCVRFVLDNPARYVFLAVGAPQSEDLAASIAGTGQATGVGLCIGSSLHFATGLVSRAPAWSRRLGMEWLYRLAQNPRRHARRVFVESFPLVGVALRHCVGAAPRLGSRP
ncbi:WecB/TagA/CpsF family glycosyltransferase [Arenibaculum pallidiluteum]|uniref:WecB/TagA/CpsF family glycosyltransferase n=1 Tax=Arenibaculum pallidiluteum TaxID=2812559 RepID=UPI001A961A31|nr:WecB/TagA/CpsF family glycosyltransferase [Arenibaculum pallidiluteum]